MAIVNATPDSFSGDGLYARSDPVGAGVAASKRAEADGASIIDIGGMSTRPGGDYVSERDERERVQEVVAGVSSAVRCRVSIDTYRASVAQVAIDAGASIVNSVRGLRTKGGWNRDLAAVCVERGAQLVLSHDAPAQFEEGTIGGHYRDVGYPDVVDEVIKDLSEQIEFAVSAGIQVEKLIVDPGIGFGKGPSESLQVLRRAADLRRLHAPILVSVSRKSVLAYMYGEPLEERDVATATVSAMAPALKIDIVRVHNVLASSVAIKIATKLQG